MQHLDTERIAAFDHEAPSPEELVHLAACAVCRAERDAFDALAQWSSQSAAASADASLSPRLSDWESLSKVLRREGLLTSASDHRVAETPLVVRALDGTGERIERSAKVPAVPAAATPSTGRPFPSARQWLRHAWLRHAMLRNAATIALLVGGVAAGRMSAGASVNPFGSDLTGNTSYGSVTGRVASLSGDDFASVAQATAVLGTAQRDYERASLWLAANDTTVRSSDVYRARLTALDQMMAASQAALREAPQDPVINHYFLAASTAREATLQQLSGVLPVDKTLEGY